MSALTTSNITIPVTVADKIWAKALDNSTLATLAQAQPQKFGESKVMVLTSAPKAELVGEGGEKSPTPVEFATKTVTPRKLQVTVRVSDEVKWADEDYMLGVWETIEDACSTALGRALDLVGYHKLNPLTGAVAPSISEGVTDTANSATLSGTNYDAAIEAAEGLVIAKDYMPNGVALSPAFAFGLKTQKDADGRRLYPNMGDEFDGMKVAKSSTVNAPEATVATGIKGIVGDFDAFKWGVQRNIGAKMIEFGDPDGLGDLQRMNQVAIRMEIVYGIGIMDLNAFAKIV